MKNCKLICNNILCFLFLTVIISVVSVNIVMLFLLPYVPEYLSVYVITVTVFLVFCLNLYFMRDLLYYKTIGVHNTYVNYYKYYFKCEEKVIHFVRQYRSVIDLGCIFLLSLLYFFSTFYMIWVRHLFSAVLWLYLSVWVLYTFYDGIDHICVFCRNLKLRKQNVISKKIVNSQLVIVNSINLKTINHSLEYLSSDSPLFQHDITNLAHSIVGTSKNINDIVNRDLTVRFLLMLIYYAYEKAKCDNSVVSLDTILLLLNKNHDPFYLVSDIYENCENVYTKDSAFLFYDNHSTYDLSLIVSVLQARLDSYYDKSLPLNC